MRPLFLFLVFLCCTATAHSSYAQNRGGFTAIVTLGYGLQSNSEFEVQDLYAGVVRTYGGGTYSSAAGLNVGIGGFVSRSTALMFRLSGTAFTAKYIEHGGREVETDVVSSVAVLDVQHWFTDRFNVEGGAGWGLFSTDLQDDSGLGLLLAAGYCFYQNGKISLQLGIEDSLFHHDKRTINNLGFCLGFQLL